MFDTLRRAIKESFLLKAFMGIMILSFGVFGIGDFIGTGGLDPNVALKVGEREVNVIEFQSRYDREYTNFKESVGGQLPDSEMMRRSVMDAMVQEMTRTAIMDAAAANLGIIVTDEQLREAVRRMEAFQDPTGNFSQITYGEVLAQNGLTEPAFLDLMREDLRQRTLLQPVALGSQAPQYLVDSLFTYRAEGRVAETLLVRANAITLEEKPTDDELKAIYDQNTATFMQPEFRKLSVITLRASDLVKPESFAEEELKSYFDANAGRYRTPEKRQVSQLVFDSKEEAEKVRALAAPSDTLADLASKAGIGAPINLGEQAQESVIGKSMGESYNLPLNEISPVIETDLGWHLFAVTGITPEQSTPYEEAKSAIRTALAEDRGLDAVYSTSTELQDALAAGTPMPEIAQNLGLTLRTIEAIDQSGNDPSGNPVPNLIDRASLLSLGFEMQLNVDSGLRDLPDRDGYYVVKVENIMPPAAKPMEDVRDQLVALWQRQKTMAAARTMADELSAEIGASTNLQSLETKDGRVSYSEIGPINRFGQAIENNRLVDTGRVSASMLQRLFAAKTGEVFTADVADGVLITRLKEVAVPQAVGSLALQRNEMTASLRNAVTADMMEQLNAAFAAQYPVEVNQPVIDEMVRAAR